MQPSHMMLFYVDSPMASVEFYRKALAAEPIEASAGFAMFPLNEKTVAGFWKRDGVAPKATVLGGGSEIGFHLGSSADVDARHKAWKSAGIKIVQEPEQMDFGYTFTAEDPDGHRLRVFASP